MIVQIRRNGTLLPFSKVAGAEVISAPATVDDTNGEAKGGLLMRNQAEWSTYLCLTVP